MAISSATTRTGRPKDVGKHAAILEAAHALFARLPFDAVTMEDVAAAARVSKMTVYSHFSDKETLFETLVLRKCDQFAAALSTPPDGEGLAERLVGLGCVFLRMITDPEVAAMMQMVPVALRDNQALARRFYEAGPGRTRAGLTAIIATAAAQGELAVDEAQLAAEDLLSLWVGGLPAQLAFGLTGKVTPAQVAGRARRGTMVFLRAYAAATPHR